MPLSLCDTGFMQCHNRSFKRCLMPQEESLDSRSASLDKLQQLHDSIPVSQALVEGHVCMPVGDRDTNR